MFIVTEYAALKYKTDNIIPSFFLLTCMGKSIRNIFFCFVCFIALRPKSTTMRIRIKPLDALLIYFCSQMYM